MTDLEQAQAAADAAEAAFKAAYAAVNDARAKLRLAKGRAVVEAKRKALRDANRTRATAQRKAKAIGVTIERESFPDGPLYWVWAPEGRYPDENADPCCGEHSCCGWYEVLQKVETYEAAFAAEAKARDTAPQ